MNKEQIEKHGEVIKWFCDNADKGVWARNDSDTEGRCWTLASNPIFYIDHTYVQNDEYAELRKALSDGKVIEHNPLAGRCPTWTEINMNVYTFDEDKKHYRIKPEEPKFKVGDWVVHDAEVGTYPPFQVNQQWLNDIDTMVRCRLWKPTEGGTYCCRQENDSYWLIVENCVLRAWKYIKPLEFAITLKEK